MKYHNKFKYIGIVINRANCDPDLKRQMCKLYANVNIILRTFSNCSPDVKCFFYLDLTVLTVLKNLIIAYNNNLRKLMGIPKYNSAKNVCLNILSFNELLRKYVYFFRSRLMASYNRIFYLVCVLQLSLCILLSGLGGMHSHYIVRCNIAVLSFLRIFSL